MTDQEWIDSVVGKPWEDRATGPDYFDCWGVVMDYFDKVVGIDLPTLPREKNDIVGYVAGSVFVPTDCDTAILFTRFVGNEATHVGLKLGDRVIHALGTEQTGGQVYNHTMRHIRALFRHDKLEFWKCR